MSSGSTSETGTDREDTVIPEAESVVNVVPRAVPSSQLEIAGDPADAPDTRSKSSPPVVQTASDPSPDPREQRVERAHGPRRVAASVPKLTPADELEMRLARVWYWEGAFSRRGINLQRHFTDNHLTITDLDLLAIEITSQLGFRRSIGEAKSGTGKAAPKPMDRCLWLAGVARLVEADTADFVTTLAVSSKVRQCVVSLGVRPMTVADLQQREDALDIGAVADVGSHGATAMARAKAAHAHAKRDRHWERAFWFLRCEVWFLDPWHAVKRCIGLLESLANWWTPHIEDDDQAMLRWLYAESLGVFALNAVALAGQRLTWSKTEWQAWARERLAEGVVPMHQMKVISDAVDRFVAGVLGKWNALPHVQAEAMGTFLPLTPEWAEGFLELVERLASDRLTARELPRHVDLVVHERLVHRRQVDPAVLARVNQARGTELDKTRRQMAAFLRGNARVPEAVDKALSATTGL